MCWVLPCAKDRGAEIYTKIEVERIEKLSVDEKSPGGPRYRVHYVHHTKGMLGVVHSKRSSVTANNVFLGAGSAGSTQILMRSQTDGFEFSDQLGTRVSANGDVLGFVYNSNVQTNIAASMNTGATETITNPVGQTITVFADYREANKEGPLDHQFVLLDGAIPRPLVEDVVQTMGLAMGWQYLTSPSAYIRVIRDMVSRYPSQSGAINHSMLLLACGHDSSGGKYVLDGSGNAYAVWPGLS